mgnify:CR=1 FL=1
MKKILGYAWFSGSIGIILKLDHKELKCYIGKGKGFDEDKDLIHIADYGSPFPIKQGNEIIRDSGTIREIILE